MWIGFTGIRLKLAHIWSTESALLFYIFITQNTQDIRRDTAIAASYGKLYNPKGEIDIAFQDHIITTIT